MLSKQATLVGAVALAGLTAILVTSTKAVAQQRQAITGIDKIHAQARAGSKVCMVRHKHGGEGTMPSEQGAEAAAIRAWQVFTADEYGTAWGEYEMAAAKTMRCTEAAGAWTCQTTARPCRAAR